MKFSELINQNKPVLIDFYTEWCSPCKIMSPILEDLKSELGDEINIVKVDVDKNLSVATKFQIKVVPTLILIQSGKLLWRQSGVLRKRELINIINSHIAQP
jgi:thioredoxin 1